MEIITIALRKKIKYERGEGMATIEKTTIKTEAIFSDDKKHRFNLKKEWDKTKEKALVIMKSASDVNGITLDHTTIHVVNNLAKLDFGTVEIMNLFTEINTRITADSLKDKEMLQENNNYIIKAAVKADKIIIAWGRCGNNNKSIKTREVEVLKLLEKQKGKIYQIADEQGREGFHPLASAVRLKWYLSKLK